jgi:hypothetical protein
MRKRISAAMVAGSVALGLLVGLSVGPALGAETRVCRGILMENWTDGVADYTPNDETRLIMCISRNSN